MSVSSLIVPLSTRARSRVVIEIALVTVIVALVAAGQARLLIGTGMLLYGAIALASPLVAAGLLVAFLVFVSASRYGIVFSGAPSDWDLYWLGVNQLNVSAAELFLIILFLASVTRRATGSTRTRAVGFPIRASAAFAPVYALQVALALARGTTLGAAVNFYSGRLLFDALLTALLVAWIVEDHNRERATEVFVSLIAIRAAYGLMRYALFGGDPLNFYANFQHIDVTR